jgi:hypothetical protein
MKVATYRLTPDTDGAPSDLPPEEEHLKAQNWEV